MKGISTLATILLFATAATASFWLMRHRSTPIDEQYAALVTKKALTISEPVTAKVLSGGLSGMPIFLVTTDSTQYVVRFLISKSPDERNQEISGLKIASQEGYGPHLYFVDPKQEYVIMEYIKSQPLSLEQRQSDKLYRALGNLLRKIHHGPAFSNKLNFFDDIQEEIQALHAKNDASIPLAKIESIIMRIRQAVTPYLISAPSHGDLNPNNLLFDGNDFKAIDYEGVMQTDPYVDLATVAIYYCFDDPLHESILLSTYLGRQPSSKEEAKLYLAKQAIWIRYAAVLLYLTPEKSLHYESVQVQRYWDFLKEFHEGNINLEDPEQKQMLAKAMTNQVLANAETQEFRDAIKVLGEV
jgi:thiamine kinase-like enzyme